jgi:hypothetical protein
MPDNKSKTLKWEYKTDLIDLSHLEDVAPFPDSMLNAHGANGWELVSVIPTRISGAIRIDKALAFYKRPSTEERKFSFGGAGARSETD